MYKKFPKSALPLLQDSRAKVSSRNHKDKTSTKAYIKTPEMLFTAVRKSDTDDDDYY